MEQGFWIRVCIEVERREGKKLKLKTVKNKGNIIGDVVCSCVSGWVLPQLARTMLSSVHVP